MSLLWKGNPIRYELKRHLVPPNFFSVPDYCHRSAKGNLGFSVIKLQCFQKLYCIKLPWYMELSVSANYCTFHTLFSEEKYLAVTDTSIISTLFLYNCPYCGLFYNLFPLSLIIPLIPNSTNSKSPHFIGNFYFHSILLFLSRSIISTIGSNTKSNTN